MPAPGASSHGIAPSRWGLLLPSLLLFVATACTLGLAVRSVAIQAGNAERIDLAGRQRMLNARHVSQVLLTARGESADFRATRQIFRDTARALREGGTALFDIERGTTTRLAPIRDTGIRDSLIRQSALFDELVIRADRLLTLDAGSPVFTEERTRLLELSDRLHVVANSTVRMLDSNAEHQIVLSRRWIIACVTCIALMGLWLVARELRFQRLLRRIDSTDVEKRLALEQLEVSNERFDLAVAGSTVGIWDWDAPTDTIYYAPRFKALLGFADDEFPDDFEAFRSRLHPDDFEPTLAAFRSHLKHRTPYDVEYRLRTRSDEYRWFSARGQALWDEDGRPTRMSGSITDITDQKRNEQSLREAKEHAEAANIAKSQFLANMSHELRTPLNSVIGFSNILHRNKAGNLRERDLNFLERIRENGTHLLALINDVLDLSKIEADQLELHPGPVRVDDVVREVVESLEPQAATKGLTLTAKLPQTLTSVTADELRFKQVLINLVANALKFTERGHITVHVQTVSGTSHPARVEVIDTGIGIDPAKLDLVFKKFQQADTSATRQYGGTGLGLSISRALCRMMGFDLVVTSREGAGSTFSIVLESQPERPTPPAPQLAAPVASRGPHVLVIDDDPDSRMLLKEYIEETGFQVELAGSGEEGLARARSHPPRMITLDLMMPGMNGWEVLHRLKSDPTLRDVPVVVVSIVAGENRGAVIGALDALPKPVDRRRLQEVLHAQLTRVERVLIVDDDPDARELLRHEMSELGLEIDVVADGDAALERVRSSPPDLVLLDLLMPGVDGTAVLVRLRNEPNLRDLPVIVVTAKELAALELVDLASYGAHVVLKGEQLGERVRATIRSQLGRTTPA